VRQHRIRLVPRTRPFGPSAPRTVNSGIISSSTLVEGPGRGVDNLGPGVVTRQRHWPQWSRSTRRRCESTATSPRGTIRCRMPDQRAAPWAGLLDHPCQLSLGPDLRRRLLETGWRNGFGLAARRGPAVPSGRPVGLTALASRFDCSWAGPQATGYLVSRGREPRALGRHLLGPGNGVQVQVCLSRSRRSTAIGACPPDAAIKGVIAAPGQGQEPGFGAVTFALSVDGRDQHRSIRLTGSPLGASV
jgi:hypothetical protein